MEPPKVPIRAVHVVCAGRIRTGERSAVVLETEDTFNR